MFAHSTFGKVLLDKYFGPKILETQILFWTQNLSILFLGSMLPQYMTLCVSYVCQKKFKVQYLLNGSSDLHEI